VIAGAVLATALVALMGLVALLVALLGAVIRNDGYGQRPPPPRLGAEPGRG
jgi:hypothetical protein